MEKVAGGVGGGGGSEREGALLFDFCLLIYIIHALGYMGDGVN
jgi:hypothetical protein